MTEELFDFTAAIAEAKDELHNLLEELPGLHAVHQAAELTARDARDRFRAFVARYNAACRNGRDSASPALDRMLDAEARARDAADTAVIRAKHVVDECLWRINRTRDGLRQLKLAENPPLPEPVFIPPPPWNARAAG